MTNNLSFQFNQNFGRLPEKESPPGPYHPSGSLPPFSEGLMPTPETTKTLGNMNLGLNGNMQGTTEPIQVQMPHQVRYGFTAFIIFEFEFSMALRIENNRKSK